MISRISRSPMKRVNKMISSRIRLRRCAGAWLTRWVRIPLIIRTCKTMYQQARPCSPVRVIGEHGLCDYLPPSGCVKVGADEVSR